MDVKRQPPSVRLRRLAAELRRLRAEAGLSQEDVAERTGINTVTLYRLESARTKPQRRTLLTLLTLYESDDERREHLLTLSKEVSTRGWLQNYSSELPQEYTAYIGFESEAKGVRNYESLFIPGLLQTEDYARAVIRGVLPTANHREIEDRVHARMERQQVLVRESPLRLWAIIDEAAARRKVGGAAVMRAQLEHLLSTADDPHVTLQVIPFDSGAHAGMPGSFAMLEFADPMDTDLVYIDSMAGDLFLEREAEVRRYASIFDLLRADALSPTGSCDLLGVIVDEIR